MPTNGEKPRVLMVDDEPDFQALVRSWISPRYEHVALIDGAELMPRLESSAAQLVVLDVRMPGADGFELCRRIRADRRFADLPVLFLTGSTEAADYYRNFAAGGTAYLMKPVGRKQLLTALNELIARPAEDESVGVGD